MIFIYTFYFLIKTLRLLYPQSNLNSSVEDLKVKALSRDEKHHMYCTSGNLISNSRREVFRSDII